MLSGASCLAPSAEAPRSEIASVGGGQGAEGGCGRAGGPGGAGGGVPAGAAYRGDDEIAHLYAAHRSPDLGDLGQCLMPDHQVVKLGWRRAVLKRADLFVSAADADIEHAKLDLIGLGQAGFLFLDQ